MTKTWAEVWEFRASMYGSLAQLVLEPIEVEKKDVLSRSFWGNFPLEAANPHLKAGLEQLLTCTSNLEKLEVKDAIEQVMVEYTKLFLGPGVPKAPPIESFYRSDRKLFLGETTTMMKQKLSEYGLESVRKDKQPEDHLGLELLFISVQTEQIESLNDKNKLLVIKEQLIFIEQNLLTWLPELCQDAKDNGTVYFYSGLFELILGVLVWDKELLNEFIENYEESIEKV